MSPGNTTAGDTRRFHVQSADGTPLAVFVDGEGPALVLVHGSLCDHTRWDPVVAELRDDLTAFAMDRRGFGESGDAEGYSIEREFEDVAAVADAVAARTGTSVALWGHSYGAGCAMGGAAMTTKVDHLVLYEPGLGLAYPPGSVEAVDKAVAAGDMETAIVLAFCDVLEMTEAEVEAQRASPMWPIRLAAAPTLPRECRTEEQWLYRPGQFETITAPTLLLTGSKSPPVVSELTNRAAAAIPDAQIRVLDGHGHFAHQADPAMVAAIIRQFIAA
jgi:pimeloyl-ACP methyl ester carboxylesterase